jgi:hypothetical protein
MNTIIYTTPTTYDKNNALDEELLTGQVAYLIKDNEDGTGTFSVRSREDGERFEKLLPFDYLTRHEVEIPHPKDNEEAREHMKKGGYSLTIGRLKEFLEEHKDELDDDGIVYYQRIEDFYFERNGWDHSVRVKYDYFGMDMNPLDMHEDQYIVAFSPVKYKNDRNLYITAHY